MNIWKKIKSSILAIPFGMKGAEDEIMVQKLNSTSDVGTIQDVVHQDSLGLDLLKGEVTQQVEELRYRTYEVFKESQKYEYIGGGVSIKKDIIKDESKIKFTQKNKVHCNSILEAMNGELNKFQINIIYEDIPKYRLESIAEYVDVEISDTIKVDIRLDKFLSQSNPINRSFINYMNDCAVHAFRNCDFEKLINLSFTTSMCDGEKDMMSYTFKDLKLVGLIETENEFIINYLSDYYVVEDLTAKFFSQTMSDKYEKKVPKDVKHSFSSDEVRQRKCDICGKIISTYDGDITEVSAGKSMCVECLLQHFASIENSKM